MSNADNSWKPKAHLSVRRSTQDRFLITYEKLSYCNEDCIVGMVVVDPVRDSQQFAEDLLAALGDYLSRRNLQDIINVCERKLEEWG